MQVEGKRNSSSGIVYGIEPLYIVLGCWFPVVDDVVDLFIWNVESRDSLRVLHNELRLPLTICAGEDDNDGLWTM